MSRRGGNEDNLSTKTYENKVTTENILENTSYCAYIGKGTYGTEQVASFHLHGTSGHCDVETPGRVSQPAEGGHEEAA